MRGHSHQVKERERGGIESCGLEKCIYGKEAAFQKKIMKEGHPYRGILKLIHPIDIRRMTVLTSSEKRRPY